jgi:selenocysteine lyase/cysteine desulfurase
MKLHDIGVETKFIPKSPDGAVTVEDVAQAIDSRTRLVSLSTVHFITGYRIDINSIGRFLEGRNILFCLDAIQSLGAFPLDTRYVDFLASGAHKWLLGPLGTGILFIKRRHFERLRPVLVGWKSVISSKDYLNYNLAFPNSALRYEPASCSILGLVGLHAALRLLLEVGIENIATVISKLNSMLSSALWEKGYDVLSPRNAEHSSGIEAGAI